jgi:hypothetical protein
MEQHAVLVYRDAAIAVATAIEYPRRRINAPRMFA